MAKIRISELPELSIATLDTTYVVGTSGSTTYKISISKLTSSLDTTFATDLVVNAISGTINSLATTQSINTLSTSVDSRLDTLENFSSSADNRYVLSGSITQTTWDNIASKPNDIVSSSNQISALGFVTGSYTTINSFNNLTQSFNSISQSFTTISGSFGDIDFSGINAVTESYLSFTQSYYSASASFDERIIAATNEQDLSYLATTGSNTFVGNQTISGSVSISQGIHNWEFGSDGIIKLNNGYGEIYADADSGSVRIGTAGENVAPNAQIILGGQDTILKIKSGPPLREWTFEGNGDFNLSGSINGVTNLVTTSSFNTFSSSYFTDSASFKSEIATEKNRIDAILSASNANTDTFAEVVSLINSVDLTNDTAFASFYTASNNRITSLENATSSYLTSLNGALSSSTQVLDGSGIYSSSAQLPTNIISSSTQITSLGFISTSVSLNELNTISASYLTFTQSYYSDSASFSTRIINAQPIGYLTTSSYQTDSASFDSRIISGSAVAGTISSSAQISGLGFATTSSVTTISGSAWGAFQSASSYSSSLQTSITTLSSSVDSRLDVVEATSSLFIPFSQSVDSRLDTLEASVITGSANYVQVLGSRTTGVTSVGTIIISGSITTSGNPVQIMVTGDANPASAGASYTRLQIYRDSTPIGNIIQAENTLNLNVPYCLNVIDTPSAGTYTYSMRTVSAIGGTLDFGEVSGPVLTIIELKTNTNLPSLNNTFTGTNTFNGVTKFGTVGGDEGGEIEFGVPQTNTTLSTRVVADVYRDRLRIFDGNTKGVYIDLSKAPTGVGGELTWKASGFVNAGTSVTLDDIEARVTTSGNRSLEIRTTGTSFTAMASAHTTYNNGSYTYYSDKSFTMSTTFGYPGGVSWGFAGDGDLAVYYIRDTTNLRFWRMTLMIGPGYNNNFITIERLG